MSNTDLELRVGHLERQAETDRHRMENDRRRMDVVESEIWTDILATKDVVTRIERELAAVNERLTTELTTVKERLDTMDQRFDSVDRRFDGVDRRFDGVDQRFDSVDKRLDGVDKRLDSLDAKVGEVLTLLRKGP